MLILFLFLIILLRFLGSEDQDSQSTTTLPAVRLLLNIFLRNISLTLIPKVINLHFFLTLRNWLNQGAKTAAVSFWHYTIILIFFCFQVASLVWKQTRKISEFSSIVEEGKNCFHCIPTDPHRTVSHSWNRKSKTHGQYLSDFRDPHPEKVSLIMANSTCHSGYALIIISNSKGSVALGLVYNSWELNFNSPCLLHPCSPLTR